MKNTSRSYPTVSLFGISLDPLRDRHEATTEMTVEATIYTRPRSVDVVGCHWKPMTIVQKLVSVGYCSIQRHFTVGRHWKPTTIVQKLVIIGYCSIQRHSTVGRHGKPMTIVQKLVIIGYCSIQRHSTVDTSLETNDHCSKISQRWIL